jgi:Coenzyme PQQ synthesis protein D (PqqD)
LIFVFSPTDIFLKSPDLALRRFPEWRTCYAYVPHRSDLFELNTTAWLIVELCDGQPLEELEHAFLDTVRATPGLQAKALLHRGLKELVDRGVVQWCKPPDEGGKR